MKVINLELKSNRFALTGDWHFGSPAVSTEALSSFAKRVRTKRIPWFGLGDMLESIVPCDARFDVRTGVTLAGSWLALQEYVRPVSRLCLGVVPGNHEITLSRLLGDFFPVLCDTVGLKYLSETAFVKMHRGSEKPITLFLAHGRLVFQGRAGYAERRSVNREIRLREYLQFFDADLCAVGHGHQLVVAPPVYEMRLVAGEGVCHRRPVLTCETWHIMTPAMYRLYTEVPSYAESRLLAPADIGWVEVVLNSDGIESVEQYDDAGRLNKVFLPRVV
ncbi:MAG: hypothetical protein QXT73_01210 [Candidatus Methanomethylicaceae archaeon]